MTENILIGLFLFVFVWLYFFLASSQIGITHVRIIQDWKYKDWDIEYKTLFFPFWRRLERASYNSKEKAIEAAQLFKNKNTEGI